MCMELQISVMFITEHIRRDKQSKYCKYRGKEGNKFLALLWYVACFLGNSKHNC